MKGFLSRFVNIIFCLQNGLKNLFYVLSCMFNLFAFYKKNKGRIFLCKFFEA